MRQKTISAVLIVTAVALLAACQQAPVSTPMTEPEPEREPHPIEGMWKIVQAIQWYNDGTSEELNVTTEHTALEMTFDDGVFGSRGGILAASSQPVPMSKGTYVVIEQTRSLVITSRSDSPGASFWSVLYSYAMPTNDRLELAYFAGVRVTLRFERMES